MRALKAILLFAARVAEALAVNAAAYVLASSEERPLAYAGERSKGLSH